MHITPVRNKAWVLFRRSLQVKSMNEDVSSLNHQHFLFWSFKVHVSWPFLLIVNELPLLVMFGLKRKSLIVIDIVDHVIPSDLPINVLLIHMRPHNCLSVTVFSLHYMFPRHVRIFIHLRLSFFLMIMINNHHIQWQLTHKMLNWIPTIQNSNSGDFFCQAYMLNMWQQNISNLGIDP